MRGGELPGSDEWGAAVGAPPEDGTSPPRLALRDTVGLPRVAADLRRGRILPKAGCAETNRGPDPAAAKVGEGRIRLFIISSLLLPSPLGGVRGGNNRHQVLDSLFSMCLLKY